MRIALLIAISLLSAATLIAQTEWQDVELSDNTYFTASSPYRVETYEVFVPSGIALEFKIAMKEGDIAVYSWTSDLAEAGKMGVEFHGHTEPEAGEAGLVMFYKIHSELSESGALKAPFTGVHGWYLDNQSDQDVTLQLQVAGFFDDVAY